VHYSIAKLDKVCSHAAYFPDLSVRAINTVNSFALEILKWKQVEAGGEIEG
jgi:hypothetical protein